MPADDLDWKRFAELIEAGEAEIERRCGGDRDLRIVACRLWRKDAGRSTPGMAIYSARRILQMANERKAKK